MSSIMADSLIKNFVSEDFNPEKFVKDLSAQCVGADELRQQRAKIQELADNTSAQLKHNVYQNYMQFIETAKEISHLESEMYQLSQLLSDQRNLLSTLGSTRTTGVTFDDLSESLHENSSDSISKEEDHKQKLIQLLENVEGAMSLVETPGRTCLHQGSLLELDSIEGTPLKRVHAYLFNDILMIASWLATSGKRGPPRYKMQAVYDLQSLAIVNVRDHGTVKLAFKLLAFSDTRVFQCATAISKKEWLDKCEQAKKAKLAPKQPDQVDKSNSNDEQIAPSRSMSLDSNTLGMEDSEESEYYEIPPEWVLEVAEDLDSCIAQRHFEEAYNLLDKARAYIKDAQITPLINDIQNKINDRGRSLIDVLTKELEFSIEAKSLQGGGLRSARRIVRLLIQLNRSAQACHLYLRLCSAVLKARLKRIKKEGTTVSYINQLSAIAFSNIVEMSKEFLKLFPRSTNCTSGLVVWCSQEVKHLTSHFIKQLFHPQINLHTLVECIITVRNYCDQLTQLGMDFRYQLDGQLRTPLVKTIRETAEKYVKSMEVSSKDEFKPTNLSDNSESKLLMEFEDLGITIPTSYLANNSWVSLTNSTLQFSKLFIEFLIDCLSIATPEMTLAVDDALIFLIETEINNLTTAITNPQLKQKKKFLLDDAQFVQNIVIPRALELYELTTKQKFTKLIDLQEQINFESIDSLKELMI